MKSIAFIFFVVLATSSAPIFAQVDAADQKTFTKFKQLTGRIVDSKGNLVEDCDVHVSMYDYSANAKLEEWKDKESAGEFSFEIKQPIEINSRTQLTCHITAEGYLPERKQIYGKRDIGNFKGAFKKITMKRAVKLTGRLTLPASADDEPLLKPRIEFSLASQRNVAPLIRRGEFSEDGLFQVMVPEDCNMKMLASSANAAAITTPVRIDKYDPTNPEQNLGEIQLPQGVAVTGVVLHKDGEPAKGQRVLISQFIGHQYVNGSAVTDDSGKFTLPPRLGKVTIKLDRNHSADGEAAKKLIAKAIELTLKTGEEVEPIEIREADTVMITGSVTLPENQITDKIFVAIAAQGNYRDENVTLGEDGVFKFEVPSDLEVNLIIAYNEGDTIFMASLKNESLKKNQNFLKNYEDDRQVFTLKPLSADVGPLDFELWEHVPEESTATEVIFDWIFNN